MMVRVVLALLWALLTSCVTKPSAPVTPAAMTEAGYPADLQGARLYRIEPAQSTLHILVFRGGTLANLGHNHVISSATVSGHIWLHDSLQRSGFSISLPVNDLIIDDPQARMTEGGEFVSVVSDAARAGTRTNMLKPEQLDGEQHPLIRLRSLSVAGARERPMVRVTITIKDKSRDIAIPVELSITDQSLQVAGQFQIKQSEFGISPYSVAMGALKVEDELTVKFKLSASNQTNPKDTSG